MGLAMQVERNMGSGDLLISMANSPAPNCAIGLPDFRVVSRRVTRYGLAGEESLAAGVGIELSLAVFGESTMEVQ